MADNTRKPTQRYLSGRVKLTDIDNLSSDRHLYLHPGEVEPNLGKPGERTLPVSDTYYRLVTIPNGNTYDRYWEETPPAELLDGISVFNEGDLVGTANSVSKLDFVGAGVTAIASGSISTITVPLYWIPDSDTGLYTTRNVGINSTSPAVTLDVVGNVSISSTVSIGTTIDIVPYNDLGALSFEGSAGQLFSITNNLTSGSIFSVNDVSGIPSIDVDADGTVQLAPYGST